MDKFIVQTEFMTVEFFDKPGDLAADYWKLKLDQFEFVFRDATELKVSAALFAAMIFTGRITITNDRKHHIYNTDTFIKKVYIVEEFEDFYV
jgi:hypothetical protein